jgi:hypothetical protein
MLVEDHPEETLAQLKAQIAAKKTRTEAVLMLMREEVTAFGAHLMAELKAIITLQKKKRVANPLSLPDDAEAWTPEALNGLIGMIETAHETLS